MHGVESPTHARPPRARVAATAPSGPQDTPPGFDPAALIEEARERQRRRRLRLAALLLLLGAAAAAGYGGTRAGRARPASTPGSPVARVDAHALAGHGTLAFVSRGALYVLDGSTGRLVTVAGRGTRPHAPHFSPDGRRLAYSLGTTRIGVARADGTEPYTLRDGGASPRWLPDGRLLLGRRIYRFDHDGRPAPAGAAPPGLSAWSADGDRYAFVTRRIARGRNGSFHGVERLEVAGSLTGRRTVWHEEPISFTRPGGFRGNALADVVVLPHREGVLVWFDPQQSASLAADGLPVYELRGPGGRLEQLGVTVGDSVSIADTGRVAIGGGGDRYAWRTKSVATCAPTAARCSPAPAPRGRLTLEPAWSPDGTTLAFVAAAPERAGAFTPAAVARWYATRRLWLLRADATRAFAVPGTRGAAAPVWSSDGRSVLYAARNSLWLLPRLGARPVRVAGPLFAQRAWPSSYGRVDWSSQFAWLTRR